MAVKVLSLDEALEDIKKSILEKGRGPDKQKRKRRGSGSALEAAKKKYGWTAKDGSDEEFIKWHSRNHGSGYIESDRKQFEKSIEEPFEKGRGKDKQKRKKRRGGSYSYFSGGKQITGFDYRQLKAKGAKGLSRISFEEAEENRKSKEKKSWDRYYDQAGHLP